MSGIFTSFNNKGFSRLKLIDNNNENFAELLIYL